MGHVYEFAPSEGSKFATRFGKPCAEYTLELIKLADTTDGGAILPFSDGTEIWFGTLFDKGTLQGTFNRGQRFTGNVGPGVCIWTNNKRISGSGERGSMDTQFVPLWVRGRTLGWTMSRYNGMRCRIMPLADGSGTLTLDGAVQATPTLTAGTVFDFNTGSVAGGLYQGTWEFVADVDCVGFKADQDNNGDASIVFPPYDDFLGWGSSAFYWGPGGTVATIWPQNADPTAPHVETASAANGWGVANSPDIGGGTVSHYSVNSALRAFLNQPGYGNARADADGGNDTGTMPTPWGKQIHLIPHATEFISMVSLVPATVERYDEQSGTLVETITLTRLSTNPDAPYAGRFGTANGASNFTWGQRLESSDPMMVVYQPKGTGNFGSDDDESTSFGYDPQEL